MNNLKWVKSKKRNRKNKEIKNETKFMNNSWAAIFKTKNLYHTYLLIFNFVSFK